jgi:predicted O-linked N-acetylglucosamine transferase (SPINDLY family)
MSDTASLDLAAVVALRDAGRPAEAEARLREAGEPAGAEALALLSHLRLLQGRPAEAQAAYEALVARAPGSPAAQRAAARLLQRAGKAEAALAAARAAYDLQPQDDENALVLAGALLAAGQAEAAHPLIAGLAGRAPQNGPAQFLLAQVAGRLGRRAEALAACAAALQLRPDLPLWAVQGALQLELDDPEAASVSFQRALAANPDDVTAMLGLADARRKLGDAEGARQMFEAVFARRPSLGVLLQARPLPVIPMSNAEIAAARERFAATLAEAAATPGLTIDAALLSSQWFYLAYHGQDDRPLMETLDRLFAARAPDLRTRAPHLDAWRPPAETGRKIKVAFVSKYLGLHTIGRLYKGFIANLDRTRFEVVAAQVQPSPDDALGQAIARSADRALALPEDVARQRALLEAERLDAVFYPDVGMSMSTYRLAQARLAPVQAVGWGHPDTTGLSTLDYFLSSDLIEPPGAEQHYSERLVRLDRLPCFYDDIFEAPRANRAALGLPEAGTLYGCPQSLFKLHPDFDPVLAAIAAGDPQARLVFVAGEDPAQEAALRRRWAMHAPILNERSLFLPRTSITGFLGLLSQIDVLLDPPHFGSGNTLYEALSLGAPVVTWPGRFARGRIVAGAYRQMGLADAPVAERLEDYAALALALGRDPARRAALRAAIRAAAPGTVFRDARALRGFEAFLEAAVAAAGRGEALPSGWRPTSAA